MRKCLVFAMLVLFAAATTTCAQEEYVNSKGKVCGMEGTAKGQKVKALDRLKNRYNPPKPGEIDNDVTLVAMLAPGDDIDRFDESKGATVTGFVVDVKPGGKETCNCGATEPIDRDTHIELALSENAPKTQRVIVEITPRIRAKMGTGWTTEALADPNSGIKGKWVEVSGWLLFDAQHVNAAENTSPGGEKNWRATCWEIHPIMGFKKLAAAPPENRRLHPDVLRAFHQVQAARWNRNADLKMVLTGRNKKLAAEYMEEDPEEESGGE